MSKTSRWMATCMVGQSIFQDCPHCSGFGMLAVPDSEWMEASRRALEDAAAGDEWVSFPALCIHCERIGGYVILRIRELRNRLVETWDFQVCDPRPPTPEEVPVGMRRILETLLD